MAKELAPSFLKGGGGGRPVRGPTGARRGRRVLTAWVVALAWYIVTVLVLAIPTTLFQPYPTQVGALAPEDVRARFPFTINDREATARKLEQIPENMNHVWNYDDEMNGRAHRRLNEFLDLLHTENPDTPAKLRDFVQKAYEKLNIALDPTTANQFQDNKLRGLRSPLTPGQVRDSLSQILNVLLNNNPYIVFDRTLFEAQAGKIRVADHRGDQLPVPVVSDVLWWPQDVDYTLARLLARYFPDPELRQASLLLLKSLLQPNLTYDTDTFRNEKRRQEEFVRKHPITKTYGTDELIVKQGEALGPLQTDALAYMNYSRLNSMAIKLGAIMLITAIFFGAVGIYLVRFRRDVILSPSTVTLHVLPPLMAIVIGQAIARMSPGGGTQILVTLWFPAAMVGLLSSILMAPQVAFVLTLVAACLFGVVTEQDLSFLVYALFGGFAAVFASRRVRARGEVLMVGVQVGLVNVLTLVILSMLTMMRLPEWSSLLGAFLSGVACALGTLILLVIFEHVFGIITDLRLLELTGLRNPLMSQFEEKSPGSYQHVLNVVKLAEAAAQSIGANYLLVRAGAYFHDVGKMIKPKYFSENQVTLDDKRAHSRLSPYMSVLIIKNHVKEGVELARRFHLPEKVVDFIPQHHGTGLIRYFYSEAMKRYTESGAIDEPREEDFRYPGPKPQSIEAAIVMLSDSVEAVAASKFTGGQVSEGELRKLVQTAITDKFDDGQFDECDLTMRHLHLIRESFVKTLMGRYHFRVAYPTLPPKREGTVVREIREPAIAIAGPNGPS